MHAGTILYLPLLLVSLLACSQLKAPVIFLGMHLAKPYRARHFIWNFGFPDVLLSPASRMLVGSIQSRAVDGRVPVPMHTSNGGVTSSAGPSSSTATARSQNQTVVVQNPMSLDESGKLVVYEVYDVYYELSTSKLVVSSDCISYEYSDDEPYEGSLSACQQSDEAHEYDGSVDDMMVQEIMISMVMRITTSETNVRCYHNPKIKSHDDTCRGKPITQTDMK
ncbi:hypothetical protein T459_04522 [Capsicum annuum]|uniref:Uncharacterized protein n=1 Tax=Capsicum annuum TaxID=4072 RepID=A0A2G3A584_CAPAN|nr:hypothetical protein T459_04522 [Capsicum annuum]